MNKDRVEVYEKADSCHGCDYHGFTREHIQ